MKILIISSYPTPSSPQLNIFVYKLVQTLADLGHNLTVVSPKQITLKNVLLKRPLPDKANVYQPFFLSFSNKKVGSFNTYYLTHKFYSNSISRVLKKKKIEFDIVYCHFWQCGFAAMDALPLNSKPFFIAFGDSESHYKSTLSLYSPNANKELIKRVSGFISVSNKNTKTLLTHNVKSTNILFAPNAIDTSIFHPRDKREMRQKYHIPIDKKIIIYVGSFKESKGYNRVLEAIKDLEDVFGIFLGKGRIKQEFRKVLFKGCIKHFQVAEMLSCADVFVLPTKDEGSSNAIVEAMATGLPIVSSNIPAVIEQCNSSFSILVNPNSIEDIRIAIASIIYDKRKLEIMSKNAMLHSKKFNLNERAMLISDFLEKYI